MCAPGTKKASVLKKILMGVLTLWGSFWAAWWREYDDFVLDLENQFDGGSWKASPEAIHDMESHEDYVRALAAHDRASNTSTYVEAAFDLHHPDVFTQDIGIIDFQYFITSPTTMHLENIPQTWASIVHGDLHAASGLGGPGDWGRMDAVAQVQQTIAERHRRGGILRGGMERNVRQRQDEILDQ